MALNLFTADCGFDPHAQDKFLDVTGNFLNDGTLDFLGKTNMHVSLAGEEADVEVTQLENMQPGKVYTIVAANGEETQNQITFPDGTLYNGEIEATDGMIVVYKLFTDGYSVYCHRAIYA